MQNLFIINPNAGKQRHIKRLIDNIECFFADKNETYEIIVTEDCEHSTAIAREYAQKGQEMRIFACGGDGTVCNVFNGVAGYKNVILGAIPCGTGNDFMKSFGDSTAFSDLNKQLNGSVVEIDAIKVGKYYALNQASMGLDALVCYHKSKFSRLPLIKGKMAYVLSLIYCFFTGIKNHFTITIGDTHKEEGEFLFAIGANGRYCGGGFMSAPEALVSDGILDCLSIKSVSRLRILSLLSKYSKGKHLGLDICTYQKAEKITVKANKPTPVNIDGEVIFAEEITFEVLPKFVRFNVPDLCTKPVFEDCKRKSAKKTLNLQISKNEKV